MPKNKRYPRKSKAPITKKFQRRKMAIKRQPFVEQKYKETANVAPGVAPTFNLASQTVVNVPDTFEFMSQGDSNSQINGRWIYSKWLTTKMLVDYTPCSNEPIPLTYIMLQGWCKLNLNPDLPNTNVAIGPLVKTALQTHVSKVVASAYEDPLGTGDARRLKIIKRVVLKSEPRTLVQPDGHSTVFRSNKIQSLKWDVQRKIRYNHCFEAGPLPYMQCNTGNWIPFIAFQRAPTDTVALTAYPKIHFKHRHYFTDS